MISSVVMLRMTNFNSESMPGGIFVFLNMAIRVSTYGSLSLLFIFETVTGRGGQKVSK